MNDRFYFKYGILLVLNLLLGFLSYLIPKKDNTFLLGSKNCSKFFGNPKYFFLYLCKNNKISDCNWITGNKKLFNELKSKNFPVLFLYSLNGFIALLRSNFLVFTHSVSDISYSVMLPGKFNKIQTWHGTPLKKIDKGSIKNQNLKQKIFQSFITNSNENHSYHTILASSEDVKKTLVRVFENDNVKILGYPRNDVFFDKTLVYDDYGQILNLNRYEQIILYCPTFRDNPSLQTVFSKALLEKMNNYLKKMNYIFLIKKHMNEKQDFDTKNFSNIVDVSETVEDVQDLLVFTNILITDYSSIFFDFILLNRPIIFYCYDYTEYLKRSRELYYNYFEELPGPFAKTEEDLFKIITSIENIFSMLQYKEKYELFRKKFNYFLDGQSSKRLYDHLK